MEDEVAEVARNSKSHPSERPMKIQLLSISLALAAFALAVPNLFATPRSPNIIIMNTDDQTQWAVGAYGNKEIHTPNMDRLAREDMRFNQAVSKPVCSPSRAMTLTGSLVTRQLLLAPGKGPQADRSTRRRSRIVAWQPPEKAGRGAHHVAAILPAVRGGR